MKRGNFANFIPIIFLIIGLAFSILDACKSPKTSIQIRTSYPELIQEIAIRLEDPEKNSIELQWWDFDEIEKKGWELLVRSKFKKLYK